MQYKKLAFFITILIILTILSLTILFLIFHDNNDDKMLLGTTISKIRFTIVPTTLFINQVSNISGTADYPNGTVLILRADRQYELARVSILNRTWQSSIRFLQPGRRILEVFTVDNRDRIETNINVILPPKIIITNCPNTIQSGQDFTISGTSSFPNGTILLLQVDNMYELGRPIVQNGLWSKTLKLNNTGNRLISITTLNNTDKAQKNIQVTTPQTLTIQPRSLWTNSLTPVSIPDMLAPKRITLHHTYLANSPAINATKDIEINRMRQIYNGHVNGNGWDDIGYHYIIMPSGRIYEARKENKKGAHDVINDGIGIAFDGMFVNQTISQQQFDAAVELCTYLCRKFNFLDPVTPVPTPTADFGIKNIPLICLHRDRVSTECPGSNGGTTIRASEIRQKVKSKLI
jgi:hypothetical protein